MNFKDIIIYSDMDGTLLKSWGPGVVPVAPECNIKSIKRFIDEGGHFSIASGRDHKTIMCFFNYNLNMPIVQSNGTVVYDYANKKIIASEYLSIEEKKEIIDLCHKNKKYYLCCGTIDGIYQVDFNDERDSTLKDYDRKHVSLDFCMNNNLCKLCYVVDPEKMNNLKEDVDKFVCRKNINALQSGPNYLELFSANADKGKGILKAIEKTGTKDKKLVCIGDYYNDEAMLKIADIKVCPDNAPDEIKAMCDFVVANNNVGAIDDLINKLEKL